MIKSSLSPYIYYETIIIMKTLPLILAITIITLSGASLTAAEGPCKDTLKRVCFQGQSLCRPLSTVAVSRRNFTRATCILGKIKQIPFVEVTYQTTDRCGTTVTWKKVHRGAGPAVQ